MVLVTFRFFGLARLHSLWGCLAFVGFPSGFGLFVWVFAPWFPFCGVGWFFAGLFAPLVWSGRLALQTPWIVPVGLLPSVFMACFRGGLLRLLLWLPPSLCAVYLGAVQIKVHTSNALVAGCWGKVQSKGPEEARSSGSVRSTRRTALALPRPHVFMNEQAQAALGELQAQLVRRFWDSRKWNKAVCPDLRLEQIWADACWWWDDYVLAPWSTLCLFVPFCSRFYLCCALRLRADEVDAAGEDMPHLSLLMYHGYQ